MKLYDLTVILFLFFSFAIILQGTVWDLEMDREKEVVIQEQILAPDPQDQVEPPDPQEPDPAPE